jgi:hypothetical protein
MSATLTCSHRAIVRVEMPLPRTALARSLVASVFTGVPS